MMFSRNVHGRSVQHFGYRWFRKLSPDLRSLITESQTVDLITTGVFPIPGLIDEERSLAVAAKDDVEAVGGKASAVERRIALGEQASAERGVGDATEHGVADAVGFIGKENRGD